MRDKSIPDQIPTNSRRYGNHLRRTRGNMVHYYCDNCGKYAFAQRKGFSIYPSIRIFCSKKCEDEYFPRWLVALVSGLVFAAWGYWLWPFVKKIFD